MPTDTSGTPADRRDRTLTRLRRIEGQIRGLQRMVEDGRPCPDVLVQVASAQEALRAVGRELLRHHLRTCVGQLAEHGDAGDTDALVDLMYRHSR